MESRHILSQMLGVTQQVSCKERRDTGPLCPHSARSPARRTPRGAGLRSPASYTKPADAGRLGRLEPALALTPRVTLGAGLCPPSPFPYSSRTVSVPEGRQEET